MDDPGLILVIGYGSLIRGDDGLGQVIAERVAQMNLPRVRSLARHQLVPELALELAQANRAIFIDACVDQPELTVIPLQPRDSPSQNWSHQFTPESLLSLSRSLYIRVPEAWMVSVPGFEFGLSDQLSVQAQAGIELAVEKVQALIGA
ncbi:MAG: hydrogenase maturation protease [Oscillatoriales cyanobacterium RM2_1_1]|nr:hydrogenase maturation protease [Oscillatoriales cyanobacterium SM2_3_0]NJO45177.1 hydrogenase maturation protease [Oscillatoriales cyanobacterium RM2_1_1]